MHEISRVNTVVVVVVVVAQTGASSPLTWTRARAPGMYYAILLQPVPALQRACQTRLSATSPHVIRYV